MASSRLARALLLRAAGALLLGPPPYRQPDGGGVSRALAAATETGAARQGTDPVPSRRARLLRGAADSIGRLTGHGRKSVVRRLAGAGPRPPRARPRASRPRCGRRADRRDRPVLQGGAQRPRGGRGAVPPRRDRRGARRVDEPGRRGARPERLPGAAHPVATPGEPSRAPP